MEPLKSLTDSDTIAAVSTPAGTGGIAVIRVSGPNAFETINKAWKGADLTKAASHTAHFGKYIGLDGNLIDEALATVFRAPNSFTGEDTVELGIHGSQWIQREILADLVRRGIRVANPGEFTQRAFLNGKLDLAQAEGVADLISASSKAAHDLAINQVKGSFSLEFENLRQQLIEFASLLELELDFSEEDVEFADRTNLLNLCEKIISKVDSLASSYSRGAVLKNGVPVVIAGLPNAGKSSLLNLLLQEEKAIVTDIPGTTRDIIEDTAEINGVLYRFIDTAGLRDTTDKVEEIGVNRAVSAIEKAFIVIWVIDTSAPLAPQFEALESTMKSWPDKNLIILLNKFDLTHSRDINQSGLIDNNSEAISERSTKEKSKNSTERTLENHPSPSVSDHLNQSFNIQSLGLNTDPIPFSTVNQLGLNSLLRRLHDLSKGNNDPASDIIVTNARHYQSLIEASKSLKRSLYSLQDGVSADFIAQDIREASTHLAAITGAITSTHLLHSIFSRFCIGK